MKELFHIAFIVLIAFVILALSCFAIVKLTENKMPDSIVIIKPKGK